MSSLIQEQARKLGVSQTELETDVEVRKECVDRAFGSLLSRIKSQQPISSTTKRPRLGRTKPTRVGKYNADAASYSSEEDNGELFEDQDDVDISPTTTTNNNNYYNSDEDGNSENLDEFSGMEDFSFSASEGEEEAGAGRGRTNARQAFSRKPYSRKTDGSSGAKIQQQRRQRGYHKFAGLFVCVLSTGETGYVLRKPGGRLHLKLRGNANPVSSSAEKLMVLSHQPETVEECQACEEAIITEIYEASRFVPQIKDLQLGQRVALLKFENATGRITRLPEDKKVSEGLGHVLVELDATGEEKKTVVEQLRMIEEDHAVIAPTTSGEEKPKQAVSGRPTKAVLARKPKIQQFTAILPHSKRGEAWRRELRGICLEDRFASAKWEMEVDEDRAPVPIKQKPKSEKRDSSASTGQQPQQRTRGKKSCAGCNAIIATACRKCAHCGMVCERKKQ